MDEKGLDGLLVFGSDSPLAVGADQYLTNDRPGQHIVFPRLGKMVCMVPSTQFIAQHLISVERGEETWAEDLRVGMGGTTVVSILKEKGLENKRIGTVGLGALGTSYHREGWVPYQTWLPIKEALPNTTLQDVTFEFVVLMVQRSARDIACLRRAAESAEIACRAVIAAIHADATETDVYSVGMYALLKSGAYATWMILTSGDDNFSWGPPTWAYREQAPRILKEGDIVSWCVSALRRHGGTESSWPSPSVRFTRITVKMRAGGQTVVRSRTCIHPARRSFGDVCDAMEQPVRDIGGYISYGPYDQPPVSYQPKGYGD